MTQPNRTKTLTLGGCLLGAVILGAYLYHQIGPLILGPKIQLAHPTLGATVQQNLITLGGLAERIDHLFVNDGRVFTDARGRFEEKFLLAPGYNVFKIEARDRFGRTVTKIVELVYRPDPSTSDQKLVKNIIANGSEEN